MLFALDNVPCQVFKNSSWGCLFKPSLSFVVQYSLYQEWKLFEKTISNIVSKSISNDKELAQSGTFLYRMNLTIYSAAGKNKRLHCSRKTTTEVVAMYHESSQEHSTKIAGVESVDIIFKKVCSLML